tara:strand:+ start:274 stop:807 length:534 start_codon:yes stop_codon:yes gene_type:complete
MTAAQCEFDNKVGFSNTADVIKQKYNLCGVRMSEHAWNTISEDRTYGDSLPSASSKGAIYVRLARRVDSLCDLCGMLCSRVRFIRGRLASADVEVSTLVVVNFLGFGYGGFSNDPCLFVCNTNRLSDYGVFVIARSILIGTVLNPDVEDSQIYIIASELYLTGDELNTVLKNVVDGT